MGGSRSGSGGMRRPRAKARKPGSCSRLGRSRPSSSSRANSESSPKRTNGSGSGRKPRCVDAASMATLRCPSRRLVAGAGLGCTATAAASSSQLFVRAPARQVEPNRVVTTNSTSRIRRPTGFDAQAHAELYEEAFRTGAPCIRSIILTHRTSSTMPVQANGDRMLGLQVSPVLIAPMCTPEVAPGQRRPERDLGGRTSRARARIPTIRVISEDSTPWRSRSRRSTRCRMCSSRVCRFTRLNLSQVRPPWRRSRTTPGRWRRRGGRVRPEVDRTTTGRPAAARTGRTRSRACRRAGP